VHFALSEHAPQPLQGPMSKVSVPHGAALIISTNIIDNIVYTEPVMDAWLLLFAQP